MRVAVVGGAGFVGGHVIDALLANGHEAIAVDQRYTRRGSDECRVADVRDAGALWMAFHGVDAVVHLAAVSNTQEAVRAPLVTQEINCGGTVNVLQAARHRGVKQVIVASSSLISGLQQPLRLGGLSTELQTAAQGNPIVDEFCPVNVGDAYHPYLSSKIFAEMAAHDYRRRYGVPTTVFRLGIQYGERMTPGVVTQTFIERALAGKPMVIHGDGSQWRQYAYVVDVAWAFVMALEQQDRTIGGTYNIVPHRVVRIRDIAHAVRDNVPGATIEHGPPRQNEINVSFSLALMARKRFGWEATTPLDIGIAHTVKWYRQRAGVGVG